LKIDASVETKQLKKLADLKARRDNDAVRAALALVTETARGDGNLMPVIVDAVKTYATLGEVSDAMREVFGEFDAPVFI
ncbi:MAG: methylmalonyl-CoA mutase family protein, partial [bacterium]